MGLAALELASWAAGGSGAAAPGVLSEEGGGMLLLLLSSLGALLLGVLLSLGGSVGGVALSEAEEGGSDGGGGAAWRSEGGSAGAASSGGQGEEQICFRPNEYWGMMEKPLNNVLALFYIFNKSCEKSKTNNVFVHLIKTNDRLCVCVFMIMKEHVMLTDWFKESLTILHMINVLK